jgi:Na+-transporting NADH:ubiquinone oxidoreductase subunit C
MALDKNSNGFTFGFAIIMVIVVGAALSFTAMKLKPLQVANEADKKCMNILGAIKVETTRDNAKELYGDYIQQSVVLNSEGQVIEGLDAFDVDVKKEFRDKSLSESERNYPLFVAEVDGKTYMVIPMVGKGLWGAIWGFVGLQADYTTIFGASFDHKTETPGLGAEIKTPFFEDQFAGKTINYDGGKLFEVTKGAGSSSTNYQVDGITGGTITSKGVEEMLIRTFEIYQNYFNGLKASQQAEETTLRASLEVEEVMEETQAN